MVRTLLFISFTCMIPVVLSAQDCSLSFVDPEFDFRTEADTVYGTSTGYNGEPVELGLKMFKPVGDGQLERPLVVMLHGGWFENGERQDMYGMCETLARSGWAAAAVSYRQQFYADGVHPMPWAYDSAEVGRTIYRAMQDVKGAIRYLKGRHELDSTSTTNIIVVGFTAGAFAGLEAAYLTETDQKPTYCGAIDDVVLNGNNYARPDLGAVEGDLNINGYDASFLGVVSFMGAITNPSWITDQGPALYTYHQTGDPMVACDQQRPYWGVNLSIASHYPVMSGACAMDVHAQGLSFPAGAYQFNSYAGDSHTLNDPIGVFTDAVTWGRNLFCPMSVGTIEPATGAPAGIFPNPTNGTLHVAAPLGANAPYVVRDAMGRTVHSGQLTGNTLDLAALPNGIYWLQLKHEAPGHRVVIAR